jgi:adenine-specific DNA-methyltransferase
MEEANKNSGNYENSTNSGSDNVWMPLSKDWNKERLTQLKNLFPDLFTNEGKLNIDELKKVVDPSSVSETERYEFRWFGKSAAKRNAFTPSNATLVYDEARSVNPNESENLIIEGENLEVLKLLSDSYRGQIKCIYIDPPYNTGKDFVYSDNYTEDKKPYWEQTGVTENGVKIDTNVDSDGRYHSNWLNMMYSRLLIARQLLREDGVIFISIDDNEVHHLRKLCDEVFGEENFIGTFINNSTPNARDYGHIGKMHEFCMFYAKDILYTETNLLEDKEKRFSFKDDVGEFNVHPLYNSNVAFTPENRPNLYYPFYLNPEKQITEIGEEFYEISLTPNEKYIEIYPPKSVKDGVQFVWRWGKDKAKEELNKEIIGYETEDGELRIVQKMRTSEKLIRSILSEKEFTSRRGTAEVEKLFGKKIFSFPKPVELIKTFLKVATDKNSIVLDFFAGAGTTGQAVIELNQEDGGNRKFILVQIPEQNTPKSLAQKNGYKTISEITIERNKLVIEKIIEEKKKQQPDLFTDGHKDDAIKGLGFKVFKLVKSNFPRVEWAPDVEKSDEENIASLKKYIRDKEAQLVTAFNKNDLLTEILLKKGFQLNYKTVKQEQFKKNEVLLATDGIKETLICLDVTIEPETVEYFKKHTDKKFICLERALDTTKKWNLKHYLGDMFNAF